MTMIDNIANLIPKDKKQQSPGSLGLYIHIPFCVKKCAYCDFCSYPIIGKYNAMVEKYVDKITQQLISAKDMAKGHRVDTVYFGGGTPSLLSSFQLEKIIDTVVSCYGVEADAEISVECNPGTVYAEKLADMRRLGVNRLSIGAQSFNDRELVLLGRIHTAKDFENAFKLARAAGFDNISADLMYGIPEQSMKSFEYSIARMCDLSPEHISSYALSVEPGTFFGQNADLLSLPDDDTVGDMYDLLVDTLERNGYERYEISNFSKQGKYSRHNMRYWKGLDYLGFGVSAHSFFNGVRYFAKRDIDGYLNADFSDYMNCEVFDGKQKIDSHDLASEYIMLRLRLAEGISCSDFRQRFGINFEDHIDQPIEPYIAQGFMKRDGDRIFFTTKGFCVSNYILSEIIDFDET